ncbi:AAA family ATPase [Campylobacter fetus]|uniref:AAA family ATPase n=1 Tax=Campylobacter fetus TaxID=196 RepID=UPI00073AA6AC|nr:AAA family ATPase [Campylobacter fetus]ALV65197.1 DNA repair protein RecN [Campylobacter fetus subsp. testudinum Sp3]EAK0829698.1 DNA recombination protein RecN [Campylobacter fetus]
MISRVYIKNYLGFSELELNFGSGLSVFTGVSGAGKSVLMGAILSVFGFKDSEAKLIEADVEYDFCADEFGIETTDINTFKLLKDKSTRYFINNQSISKKNLSLIAGSHLKYLSAKEIGEFENSRLISVLDSLASKNDKNFVLNLKNFTTKFDEFALVKKELEKVLEEEKKVDELKEFASFEIQKISSINPKIGEFDELIAIKKKLSKKDKIEAAWQKADVIFNYEKAVLDALEISDIDGTFFNDALNELKIARSSVSFDEFDDIDIEEILDRIENLNGLIKRYGSIEEAIDVLNSKKAELAHYEKIEFEKSELESKFKKLHSEVLSLANAVSKARNDQISQFAKILNGYLKELYMDMVSVKLSEKELGNDGIDTVEISLNSSNLKTLSSGEINRLRLAFIASEAKITGFGNGVLILDEIDSNLSGKEAMSIADVLLELAKFYQIFAISHQPQLSSKAHHHFLVEKNAENSFARELDASDRIKELSRMISGEVISEEAKEFAKTLLNI